MELKDTAKLMQNADYKERFKAEYYQTKIRYEKLKHFTTVIRAAEMTGEMDNAVEMPEHDCPTHLLVAQQKTMRDYLDILEVRAVIEGIEL